MSGDPDGFLDFDTWAKEQVEHATEEEAWAAFLADAAWLKGQTVWISGVETGHCERIEFDRPVLCTVTAVETRKGWVNVNEDPWVGYIDPYIDVRILAEGFPQGAGFTYGRSHTWKKEKK